MPKIQIKRGSKAKLPTLAPGEFGLATDAGELYIGGAGKNLHIPVLGSDGKVPGEQLPDIGGFYEVEEAVPPASRKANTLYGLILADYTETGGEG